MPLQLGCPVCKCGTFYVMNQDNGSVEVFCTVNNHRTVLVNIPELVKHLYKTESEDSSSVEKLIESPNGGTTNPQVENEEAPNHSTSKHGAPTTFDLRNHGRTTPR